MIVYPHEGVPSVKLTYRRDKLTEVAPGPALLGSDVLAIGKEIEHNLIADTGTVVVRSILFSSMPIAGSWRRGNSEQIMPVADDDPKAPRTGRSPPVRL